MNTHCRLACRREPFEPQRGSRLSDTETTGSKCDTLGPSPEWPYITLTVTNLTDQNDTTTTTMGGLCLSFLKWNKICTFRWLPIFSWQLLIPCGLLVRVNCGLPLRGLKSRDVLEFKWKAAAAAAAKNSMTTRLTDRWTVQIVAHSLGLPVWKLVRTSTLG